MGWGTRATAEAEWVIKVEDRGTAAFGAQELSRFWFNCRVVEIFITRKGAQAGAEG